MKNKLRKGKFLILGLIAGAFVSASSVSAQTRDFLFHMDTSYGHGKFPNCGYSATKADDEQAAYITVTKFQKVQNPTISMWVAPYGGTTEYTFPWSWTSTAPRKKLEYISWMGFRPTGSRHQLCAEQFYSGSVVMGGRWTP